MLIFHFNIPIHLIVPKKQLGQHFLKDDRIAQRIADSMTLAGEAYEQLLEIGPGPAALTRHLYPSFGNKLNLVELDRDMIPALKAAFPDIAGQIYQEDFLKLDLASLFPGQLGIIGNFPYNISTQILFKLVDNRLIVPELVGMFQREVAQRVVAPPGSKVYGLISVWVQVFYSVEYLFTVNEGSFQPPPKVKSGVIRLKRIATESGTGNDTLLLQVIKIAFGQRRKTLRNALKVYTDTLDAVDGALLDKRAEQLGVQEFKDITSAIIQARAARV